MRNSLNDLPHMTSFLGRYTPFCRKSARKLRLWDRESAEQSAISMTQVQEAEANAFDGNPKPEDMLCFMAVVEAPVLDPKTGESEQGRYCLGCKDSQAHRSQHLRRRFNEHSFQAHIEECGPVVDDKRGNKMHRSQ